jgi:hypothetical protein
MHLRSRACVPWGQTLMRAAKVHRPSLVGPSRCSQQYPRLSADPPSPLASAHLQLLFHPMDPFAVHRPAFTLQQNVQPPIAPTAPVFGQIASSHAQPIVRFRNRGPCGRYRNMARNTSSCPQACRSGRSVAARNTFTASRLACGPTTFLIAPP